MAETASITRPASGGPWRILVVENDPRARADHLHNLRNWGFEVYPAQGTGETLLQDARRLARQHRCHLALVDMRLMDDDDPTDISGFKLVEELKPLPAFVISSFGTLQRASQAVGTSGAKEFIGKGEGPKRLRSAIESVFADYCDAPQARKEIKWANGWGPATIIEVLFAPKVPIQPREIICVVQRLFLDDTFDQVQILRFDTISGAARDTHTHSLRHSAVFRVTPIAIPVFVKLANVARLEVEEKNYRAHILHKLPSARHSHLERFESVGFVGGIRYEFHGEGIDGHKTLAARLAQMTDQDVNRCLSMFFRETWGDKYRQRKICNKTLFRAYVDVWGAEWIDRITALPIVATRMSFEFSDSSRIELPNPIGWLPTRIDLGPDGVRDATAPIAHYTAVTHGDLHCRNIFVNRLGEPCIIDFERTGEGPILRDFVEMEIDLLLQHIDSHGLDDLALHRLFVSILSPQRLDIAIRFGSGSKNLVKLSNIADKLRYLANSVAQVSDAREYYWGLLFDIVHAVVNIVGETRQGKDNPLLQEGMLEPHIANTQNVKIVNRSIWSLLLLGAMICSRLDDWEKPWPSAAYRSNGFE